MRIINYIETKIGLNEEALMFYIFLLLETKMYDELINVMNKYKDKLGIENISKYFDPMKNIFANFNLVIFFVFIQ